MSKSIHFTPVLTYFICLSFFGLFLVGTLSVYPPTTQGNFLWRKPLIGSVFSLICILGIFAAVFPKQCSRLFDFVTRGKWGRSSIDVFASHGIPSTTRGHHPDCKNFFPHVFRIGNRTFCTACTGLLLGGLATLVGTILYFFGEWTITLNSSLLVWVGLLGIGLGLFQFKARRTAIRLSLNTFFVWGTFLVLVGVDKLVQDVFADMFLVLLAVFWLYTRILLSEWDHRRICYMCNASSCEFLKLQKKWVSICDYTCRERQG